jgi:hypothetical protein
LLGLNLPSANILLLNKDAYIPICKILKIGVYTRENVNVNYLGMKPTPNESTMITTMLNNELTVFSKSLLETLPGTYKIS